MPQSSAVNFKESLGLCSLLCLESILVQTLLRQPPVLKPGCWGQIEEVSAATAWDRPQGGGEEAHRHESSITQCEEWAERDLQRAQVAWGSLEDTTKEASPRLTHEGRTGFPVPGGRAEDLGCKALEA